MKRQSRVVLRVYEQGFEDERGKGKRYLVRTFGVKGFIDRNLLCAMVKHHFEGIADEGDILYALWQSTGDSDWEEFACRPEVEWTPLQKCAYDHVWEVWGVGPQITVPEIHNTMLRK